MATTFLVRTAGAGVIREDRVLADTKAQATRSAIRLHRSFLRQLALDTEGDTRSRRLLQATTASILVSTVEVITFASNKIGDTYTDDAA